VSLYTIDWEGTSSLVREKVIPRIKDQFFKSNALMYRLRPKAEYYSGGSFIRQPLSFQPEGGGGQWFAGTDRFNTTVRQPFGSATFQSKNYELPIVVTQDEEDTVDGPEALTSLVAAKMKVAQRSVMDAIGGANGIYNDGTNPKAITGFQYSLKAFTSTAPGTFPSMTYGGIPSTSTSNTYWNHQGDNTGYLTGSAAQSGTYIQAANMAPWDKMFAAQGLASGKTSSLIVCNWGVWNEIVAMVNAKSTYFWPQQDSELAKLGIRSFQYMGKTVVVDEQVPRNATTKVESVFFIDEDCLHLWVHTARDFAFEGWRKFIDQAARVAYIWFRGELAFDERRSSGVHSAVDTTKTSP
jgi:hypothetical protein